jgi:hypothetical protein
MDPLNDLDRHLAAAMRVEPSADFAARVRARIAEEAPLRQRSMPRFALAALACAATVLAAAFLPWRVPAPAPSPIAALLPHHPIAILAPLKTPARPSRSPLPASSAANRVVIAQSEMLALQRLFSGQLVAPPATDVAADVVVTELTVGEIQLPAIPGGGDQ